MIYRDFADQYKQYDYSKDPGSSKTSVLISLAAIFLGIIVLFFIPSQHKLKLYEQVSPPSSYQASLKIGIMNQES